MIVFKKRIYCIIFLILFVILCMFDYIFFSYSIHEYLQDSDPSIILKNIFKYNRKKSVYEGIFISPRNPFTLWFFKSIYDDTKKIFIDSIENYISFTRLNLSKNDKLNCDWCSMANGIIKLSIDSLKANLKNESLIQSISLWNIKLFLLYLDIALFYRKRKITKQEIDSFIKYTFPSSTISIYPILFCYSKLYLLLEQIELKWCPYKSMQYYYRNKDARYLSINEQTIYEAGKILSKFDTIECHICNQVLNQEMDKQFISHDFDKTKSGMYDFYIFILCS